jgi:hypothetical protein
MRPSSEKDHPSDRNGSGEKCLLGETQPTRGYRTKQELIRSPPRSGKRARRTVSARFLGRSRTRGTSPKRSNEKGAEKKIARGRRACGSAGRLYRRAGPPGQRPRLHQGRGGVGRRAVRERGPAVFPRIAPPQPRPGVGVPGAGPAPRPPPERAGGPGRAAPAVGPGQGRGNAGQGQEAGGGKDQKPGPRVLHGYTGRIGCTPPPHEQNPAPHRFFLKYRSGAVGQVANLAGGRQVGNPPYFPQAPHGPSTCRSRRASRSSTGSRCSRL